jgi:hypothetical protein
VDNRVELYLAYSLTQKAADGLKRKHAVTVCPAVVRWWRGVDVTVNCQLSTDYCQGLTVMGSSD